MKKVTLAQAIEKFGTKTRLAQAMGVSLPAVSRLKDPLSDKMEVRVAMAFYRRKDLYANKIKK